MNSFFSYSGLQLLFIESSPALNGSLRKEGGRKVIKASYILRTSPYNGPN